MAVLESIYPLNIFGKHFGHFSYYTDHEFEKKEGEEKNIVFTFRDFIASNYFKKTYNFYQNSPGELYLNFSTGKFTVYDKNEKLIFSAQLEIN